MNSEELERSLRAEFENYLNNALAGFRQDVSDFQKRFETEFEKHKTQLDQAVSELSGRFQSEMLLDKPFTQSVIEHLRLARDEGAEIAATAFGEAEKLGKESAPEQPARYDLICAAIDNISRQRSQSTILTSLVEQAANFTARGAFFIVRNERFVCWKVFGDGAPSVSEEILRN
ncbi:MAG: hypothetical protein LC730_05965, partial [Acidobacteria bacterium]|nr:hypothetical protein [Acidobacteriota bacterium]